MVYYAVILTSLIVLTSGCAHQRVHPAVNRPVLMEDIYRQSMGDARRDVGQFVADHLKEQKVFGYVKPYVPVIDPPIVKKVWVPDHKSEDDAAVLVAGHWVYLMIQGPKWFIEDEVKESVLPIVVPGNDSKGEIYEKTK